MRKDNTCSLRRVFAVGGRTTKLIFLSRGSVNQCFGTLMYSITRAAFGGDRGFDPLFARLFKFDLRVDFLNAWSEMGGGQVGGTSMGLLC